MLWQSRLSVFISWHQIVKYQIGCGHKIEILVEAGLGHQWNCASGWANNNKHQAQVSSLFLSRPFSTPAAEFCYQNISLMFSCDLLLRSCWAELKYGKNQGHIFICREFDCSRARQSEAVRKSISDTPVHCCQQPIRMHKWWCQTNKNKSYQIPVQKRSAHKF